MFESDADFDLELHCSSLCFMLQTKNMINPEVQKQLVASEELSGADEIIRSNLGFTSQFCHVSYFSPRSGPYAPAIITFIISIHAKFWGSAWKKQTHPVIYLLWSLHHLLLLSVSTVMSSWPGERQWAQVLPVSVGWQLHACEYPPSSSRKRNPV